MRRVLFSLNILLGIVFLMIIGFSLVGCSSQAVRGAPMQPTGPGNHPVTTPAGSVDFGLCQTTIGCP